MKQFMTLHLTLLAVFSLAIGGFAQLGEALAFFSGGIVMSANLGVWAFAWKNILAQKLVALSVGVIVIKYAILGMIIYSVVSFSLFPVEWFVSGMGVLVVSSVVYALSIAMLNNRLDNRMDNRNEAVT